MKQMKQNERTWYFRQRICANIRQPKNWLPAIELFGEGIFIQFNEEAVCDWENRNASRYLEMSKRLETKLDRQ